MFGSLGFPELMLIMFVALIVFGPRRLPEIGRTLGKALSEFKKATDELKNTIEREVRVDELKQITPSNLMAPLQSVSRSEPETPGPQAAPIDVVPAESATTHDAAAHPEPAASHETPQELAAVHQAVTREAVIAETHEAPALSETAPPIPTVSQAE